MYMGNNKNHKLILSRFADVAKLNAFIASRPEYATLTFKTSRLVWMLEIEDDKNQWIVGYDISGVGDLSIEHSIAVRRRRRGYVDDELAELYVVRLKSGFVFVTLPNESEEEIVIVAPQVCGRTLQEPVYIWQNELGWYYVLDCNHGIKLFETLDELEVWLHERAEGKKLPWGEWYVLGVVTDEDEWIDVVKRAVPGEFGPTPQEVVELVHKLTE
jgi:hypothetical protein